MDRRISAWLSRVSTGWVALAALVVFLLFVALVLPRQAGQAARETGSAGSPAALTGEDSGSFWLSRHTTTGRARSDVVAELARWHDSGAMLIDQNEFEGRITQGSTRAPSTLARAEVQTQVLAARAVGDLDASAGEDSGSMHVARHDHAPAAPEATMAAAQPLASLCSGPEIGAASEQGAPRYL